jgi:3-oxoacyl-[acyl-carrier-protein] synthase II
MQQAPQVVVTGMGAVSPVGIGCRAAFDALVAGRSGVGRITHFDPSRQRCRIAAEVKAFDALRHMDRKLARRLGRYVHFAIAATQEALAQATLDRAAVDPSRVACLIGSAVGDFPMLEEQITQFVRCGPGRMNPFAAARVSANMASGTVSMLHGLTGPSFGAASACATGSHSLAMGWLLLRAGLADVVLAGASEAAITPTFLESYIAMGAVSMRNDDPPRASRPFDRNRDGFVVGEGCAVLVLETLDHAVRRGAPILAELRGIGMACDGYHCIASHPEGRGAIQAMRMALETAGLRPEDVDYINAHGTSTAINDEVETRAIKALFGEHAHRVAVSSTKSMMGHCIAAAGALEAVACVMTLREGVIPPTINLDDPDPACDLDYVPHHARRRDVSLAMSNSFAFGGQACVLVFGRYDCSTAPEPELGRSPGPLATPPRESGRMDVGGRP